MRFLIPALLCLSAAPSIAEPGGGSFHVTSCNLGCSDGSQGAPISCAVVQVPSNAQLQVEWSDDVAFASISALTLRIVDVTTGQAQPGAFVLKDPRTVVFTPEAPGFGPGTAYLITIPGTAQGDAGPFVTSTAGMPNLARLACTIVPSGPPSSIAKACPTTPNSVGSGAVVAWFGSSSLALNDLSVAVTGLPADRLAVPIASNAGAMLPFGDGLLCLGAPIRRLPPTNTGSGSLAFDVDWTALPGIDTSPGADARLQLWYRDAAGGPAGFNLSDAIAAALVP